MAPLLTGLFLTAGAVTMANAVPAAAAFDQSHAALTAVVRRHVRDGLVDYAGLKADSSGLDRYLGRLEAVPHSEFDAWSREERLAFLINAYNAFTLRLVLDHYPVGSIKDIGGFLRGPWKQPAVRLWGRTLTLDDLEHGIIRKQYAEPRAHFALNCASRSCPELRPEAYRAADLDTQLDDQGRRFLADPGRNRFDPVTRRATVSALFKWFAADFGADDAGRLTFLARFAPPAVAASLARGRWTISYLPYDWSLNVSTVARLDRQE